MVIDLLSGKSVIARDERPLWKQADALTLLFEAGRLIGQSLDLHMVYDAFQSMVARAMDCDGLLVSLYTPEDKKIRCTYAWIEGQRTDTSGFPVLDLAPEGQGLQSAVIRTGEPVLVNDFSLYRKSHAALYYPRGDGGIDTSPGPVSSTRSLLMAPIQLDGRVLGTVQVQSHRLNAYTPALLELLEAMALQVAAASRNAYLYGQAREEIAERQRVEAERAVMLAENTRLLQEVELLAQRQRQFYRDVLASVTDGKLNLCDSAADLPAEVGVTVGPVVALTQTGGLEPLRRQVDDATNRCGFSRDRAYDFKLATGEAAMNAIVHGGGGEARVFVDRDLHCVQVSIVDHGCGIAMDRLPRAALEKGYTTAGTMGLGMKLMLRAGDRVSLLTGPDGTTLIIEKDRIDPEALHYAGSFKQSPF
jgi:anti-sigma regulatory factor (Ser/Thr protein kinase)/GAF domain-containing protein